MLRTAAKLVMYHGTAAGSDGQVLRRILKEGLNPNPPKRSFDVQQDKPVKDREWESLGGVYFSANISDINKFSGIASRSLGGNRVGIIAQIETKTPTITLDEDELFPLSLRDSKIVDLYYRVEFNSLTSDLMLLNALEEGIDYKAAAVCFVEHKVKELWNINDVEAQRIIPILTELAEIQVLTYLASELEQLENYYKDAYWSGKKAYKLYGPKESAANLFSQLKEVTRRALMIMRKVAEPSKVEWRQRHHKIRVTEPVSYGGTNRILTVFHWNEFRARRKQDGYYIVGEVDYQAPGYQHLMDPVIKSMTEMNSKYMLWTDAKGNVLYDQPDPEVVNQKAASVLRYRGAVYRVAKWNPYDLVHEAIQLNQKYFGGALLLDFPMSYNSSLRLLGQVNAKYKPSTGEIRIVDLKISNRYDLDRDHFLGILAHELIHVDLFQRGVVHEPGGQHGLYFQREVHRIRDMGLNVPLTEDVGIVAKDLGQAFAKPVYAIVLNGTSIMPFRSYGTQEDLDRFMYNVQYQAHVTKKSIVVKHITTTNPVLREFVVARSLATAKKRYRMTPEQYEALKPDTTSMTVVRPEDFHYKD